MQKIQDLIEKEIEYYKSNEKNFFCEKKPFRTSTPIHVPDGFDIYDYLTNGLLISSFQIGSCSKVDIYKNYYEYINRETIDSELLKGNYTKSTRSVISGYLHKDRALALYNMLKSNENYILTLSSVQNDLPFEYQFSEFTFLDDKPLYEEYNYNLALSKEKNLIYNDEFYKKIFHVEERGFIGSVGNYSNRFASIMNNYANNYVNNDANNDVNNENFNKYEDIQDYVEFAIMDKRWGNHDEICSVLLNSIKLV